MILCIERSNQSVIFLRLCPDCFKDSFEDDGHSLCPRVGLLQLGLVNVAGSASRSLHGCCGSRTSAGCVAGSLENVLNRSFILPQLFEGRMEGIDQGSISNPGTSVTLNRVKTWLLTLQMIKLSQIGSGSVENFFCLKIVEVLQLIMC